MLVSTEALIEFLYEWRRDKLAVVLLVGLMGGDSVIEAWARLDDMLPHIDALAREGRPKGRKSASLQYDIAQRVRDLANEVEPWLRQVAELETAA